MGLRVGWTPFLAYFGLFSRKVSETLDIYCAYISSLLEAFWIVSDAFFEAILDSLWTRYYTLFDVVFDLLFFDMMMCFVTISVFEIKLAYYDDNFGVIFWRVWSIFYRILSTNKLRDNSKLQDTIYQKSWKLLHNTSNIGQQSHKLHQKYEVYYR